MCVTITTLIIELSFYTFSINKPGHCDTESTKEGLQSLRVGAYSSCVSVFANCYLVYCCQKSTSQFQLINDHLAKVNIVQWTKTTLSSSKIGIYYKSCNTLIIIIIIMYFRHNRYIHAQCVHRVN